MGDHDAVVAGTHRTIHRARIQAVACSPVCILHHPNIEVAVARPLDQVFDIAISNIGQRGNNAVDARVAVAIGIDLCQTEFNLRIGCDVFKLGDDIIDIRIQLTVVAVHDLDAAENLLVADVFRAVVMDHVEHDWNDDELVSVDRFKRGCLVL